MNTADNLQCADGYFANDAGLFSENDMQIEATATTSATKLLDIKSFDFIKRQLEECCRETINNGGWILVSPDGKMYRGSVEQISAVVMTHHPIFKTGKPSFPIDA